MADLALVERDDPHFTRDLRKSRPSVWRVAQWLGDKGYDVMIPATRERPRIEDMDEYSDKGDIFISGLGRSNDRVEAKQRPDIAFTGPSNWPYPTMIVDALHCRERADQKPVAYVILNGPMTFAAVVKAETSSRWTQARRLDRKKNRWRDFIECGLGDVEFRRLPVSR